MIIQQNNRKRYVYFGIAGRTAILWDKSQDEIYRVDPDDLKYIPISSIGGR
jgi:hypothetical protein